MGAADVLICCAAHFASTGVDHLREWATLSPFLLAPRASKPCIPRAQHVNPLHEGVMPVDMDTADLHDIFFEPQETSL